MARLAVPGVRHALSYPATQCSTWCRSMAVIVPGVRRCGLPSGGWWRRRSRGTSSEHWDALPALDSAWAAGGSWLCETTRAVPSHRVEVAASTRTPPSKVWGLGLGLLVGEVGDRGGQLDGVAEASRGRVQGDPAADVVGRRAQLDDALGPSRSAHAHG